MEDSASMEADPRPGMELRSTSADGEAGAAKHRKRKRLAQSRRKAQRDSSSDGRNSCGDLESFQGDLQTYVDAVCKHLNETKFFVVGMAVEMLGMKMVNDLVKEVDEIEKNGGQMTQDGSRRRTPGGVLLNLLKLRLEPELYKTIVSSSRKKAVEFAKRRREMDKNDPSEGRRKRSKVCEAETGSGEKEEGELDENEGGERGEVFDLDAVKDEDGEQLPSFPAPEGRDTVSYGDLF
ncbi:phosphorylated adapter RNA export protein-like [Selaginella moellendorffii]|uniref:phosphorylated adapter RNA export protein-like n=1 Tax=Selaginella moellendorffii TaxID=88036 RepID=UPI000D1C7D95|nr:phosphorylated adapter RNA export protein-like [Selaginella moellendorffii]|eukprot:XP_024516084.1 phosphorylated adapter RNA export protein-like [Selaginella moellendorffii]